MHWGEKMTNLVDLFADIEIDDLDDFKEIREAMKNQKSFEQLLNNNPNALILITTLDFAKDVIKEDSRSQRAFINMLRLLAAEFLTNPFWNSRIGWLMWFWVCYARYDSYYPMKWCFHYDPLNMYREGEPIRPPGLECPSPDDPFNIKGECFVHPEWYKE